MAYREFQMPAFAAGTHTVDHWLGWLDENRLLYPVAPAPEGSCSACFGAVGYRDDGRPWGMCAQCNGARGYLDGYVPISYSLDSTIESMLHRFKDWRRYGWSDYTWLNAPLGCALHQFWRAHVQCVQSEYGRIEVAFLVPGDDQSRTFRPMEVINNAVKDSEAIDLTAGVIERDFRFERPGRGQVRPEAYRVPNPDAVAGRRVLLVDDTWTSGASMRSCAAALKQAGARTVVGLTIGRQLHPPFGTTDDILRQMADRTGTNECVVCA